METPDHSRSRGVHGSITHDQTHLEVLVSNITKAELLDAVANDAGVSKKDAESVLGAFFDLAIASAKKGDKVSWPGFGSFEGIQKAASTGRNPQTGAPVKIPARKALKFKASSTIREALNGKK
jgi:DNA-binding protein HU-beta